MNTESPSSAAPLAPWGVRELVYAALFVVGGIVSLNLLVLAVNLVLHIPIKLDGTWLGVFLLAQSVIFLGAVWLFGIARYHVGWDALGWRRFAPIGCAMSAGALIVSYLVNFCYAMVMLALGIKLSPQDVLLRFDTTGFGIILSFLLAAGLVPIVEETFFRGFVYNGLRGRVGARYAMLISALVFAALHFSLDRLLPIVFLGLILAWLYERTGSLVPGVILHATNNALALAVYLIAKSLGVPIP